MQTTLHIGPRDHGRELTDDEFVAADYEEGYKYELIDGSLYVSPQPNFPHDVIEQHIAETLVLYKQRHPGTIQKLSHKARVFVPGRRKTTSPEPDFAIYDRCPPGKGVRWQDISPMIVVEIVSDDPEKDYDRNVELYRQVPSILEYWVFDKVEEDDGPVLKVFRRDSGEQDWTSEDYGCEAVYSTELLPGLRLSVSPSEG
jgi:Uma2 family endonuclease